MSPSTVHSLPLSRMSLGSGSRITAITVRVFGGRARSDDRTPPVRSHHACYWRTTWSSLCDCNKDVVATVSFPPFRASSEIRMTSQTNKDGVADIKALENILDTCKLDLTAVDEVWPNLYIGNIEIAQNRNALKKMGITHILNAAHSKQGSIGDQGYYGSAFVYYGIPAEDSSKFDLSVHFRPACDFIHKALKKKHGKVLVHCIMGVSRSSTLVLAYLMLHHHLTLRGAIQKVIQKRAIYPNRNFLFLLLELDTQLQRKRMLCPIL
ncbi:dual specificity protein phosphatase 13A [Brachyhypopomus gauderio]|uniref:dual specificity protein phosphatase 13A n=1 Tax=Brachyhypopomus gauderio TaxID=698409 RepID=UPI0040431216